MLKVADYAALIQLTLLEVPVNNISWMSGLLLEGGKKIMMDLKARIPIQICLKWS